MWPQKRLMKRMLPMQRSSQRIEEYGGGSLWRRRPALRCGANEEEVVPLVPVGTWLLGHRLRTVFILCFTSFQVILMQVDMLNWMEPSQFGDY